jgi:hypothetical protein
MNVLYVEKIEEINSQKLSIESHYKRYKFILHQCILRFNVN